MTTLASSDVIAFLATTRPEAARKFYEETLGLEFIADEPFALVFDANGITLRITRLRQHTPAQYTVLGWLVDDIAGEVAALSARGVTFQFYDGFEQDELGICTFGDGTRVAWFTDPDGNTLSLTEG